MKGLRVYIDSKRPQALFENEIFYTRRAGGPYYQWRYEDLCGRWLSSRMNVGDVTVAELVLAPWKVIPPALKTTLNEHYVD